ncbi:MAG: hypothetical protein E7Z70_02125 [Thermoplasmata archaeon]|nr:hypothetical protein [Thermoplasmata archaeon]
MVWIGDPSYRYDRQYREDVRKGVRPEPSLDDVTNEYLRFVNVDTYSILHNEGGELLPVQQPKLGNEKHSRKMFLRAQPVMEAFDSFKFDQPLTVLKDAGQGEDSRIFPVLEAFDNMSFDSRLRSFGRDVRLGYAFFITLTYDHKQLSPIQAYDRVSDDINRFKARLEKILGPYVCQTVKEASESGYPAPHLLFITIHPHLIFKHNGVWRLKDYNLYKSLHNAWWEISGSQVSDVEAIVDNSVNSYNPVSGESCRSSAIRYVFKYMTKTCNYHEYFDEKGNISIPDSDRTRIYTLAMMKYSGCRTILSRKFMSFLGIDPDPLDTRLVELCNELKRLKARKKYLEQLEKKFIHSFGWFLMPESLELPEILVKIAEVRDR